MKGVPPCDLPFLPPDTEQVFRFIHVVACVRASFLSFPFTEEKVIYRIVLISALQQSDSVRHTSMFFSMFFSTMTYPGYWVWFPVLCIK